MTDKRQRNRILLVLFVGVLMGALDIAIVGPALPAIQAAFGVDARAVSGLFTIYVLLNLVGTPWLAKLADTAGRRPIYIRSVAVFALGSLIVALSPAFEVVLLGRAIQGFGADGIFSVASAVIGDSFPLESRAGAARRRLRPGLSAWVAHRRAAPPGRLALALPGQPVACRSDHRCDRARPSSLCATRAPTV